LQKRGVIVFDFFKKKCPPEEVKPLVESESVKQIRFPPVPDWQPAFEQPIDRVIGRFQYYADGKKDFAVFSNGTVAILPLGLSDADAEAHANDALHKVFYAHLDMNPRNMDDGNVLVGYNHDVLNIALSDVTEACWSQIDANHQAALATDEVLITPLGPNVFDDLGKKALFARCFLFMDAQSPQVVRIVRNTI
jgi:hypothetical protein